MSFLVNIPSGDDPNKGPRMQARAVRQFPTWVMTLVGVLTVLLGIGFLLWPLSAATWVLSLMIGGALVFGGIGFLIRLPATPVRIVAGVLFIFFGTIAMIFSDFTVNALLSFVGASFVFFGAIWLIIAAKLSQIRNLALIVPPVLLTIGGIVALVWPEFAIVIAAIVLGIITIAIGVSLIWAANRMRKLSARQATIIID